MAQVTTKVRDPDGLIIPVRHPEGSSESDILSFARNHWEKTRFAELDQEDIDAGGTIDNSSLLPTFSRQEEEDIRNVHGVPEEPIHPKDLNELSEQWVTKTKGARDHLYENKFAYTLGVLGMAGGPWTSAALSAAGTGLDTMNKDENAETDKILLYKIYFLYSNSLYDYRTFY